MKFNRYQFSQTFFKRLKKFLKRGKFDFYFKPGQTARGHKKLRILLVFIFAIINRLNSRNSAAAILPPLQTIAQGTRSHLSWVKQVKAQYFGACDSELAAMGLLRQFGVRSCWEQVHSFKELAQLQTEVHHQACPCNAGIQVTKSPLVSKTRVYCNFINQSARTKPICRCRFFKFITLELQPKAAFSKWFSLKSQRVTPRFLNHLLQPGSWWGAFPWLWKTLEWLQSTFVCRRQTQGNCFGIIANWF